MTIPATYAPVDDSGRREINTGLRIILALVLGFGVWAALAPLDAAVVAPGVVMVSGNRQTVQHREGGVVTRLAVREGQKVRRGEVLIELAAPEVLARERALFSQVVDLQMQRARLTAEALGQDVVERPPEWAALSASDRAIAEAAFERHQQELAGGPRTQGAVDGAWSKFDARIAGYRDEIASVDRQKSLLQDELRGIRRLAAEKLVPLTRLRALERELAQLQGRRAELSALIAATEQDRSQALRTVEARLAELAPQLAGAREQVERTRLRAPVDGVVVGLTAHTVGGVVQPGEHVLDVVPNDRELIIEAQVRPEDADDLKPGQTTEVRITAFGGRDLPILHGAVRQVSADRLTDERTGRGYFLAHIVVPRRELDLIAHNRAGGHRLQAGLSAQVIVPTRKRTALQYLLEPLNQALWRSFRET